MNIESIQLLAARQVTVSCVCVCVCVCVRGDAFAETSASFLNFHASLQDARSDRGRETKQGLRSFGVGGATTFFGGFGLRLLQK